MYRNLLKINIFSKNKTMRPLKNAKFCFSGKEGENFNHRNTPPYFED
jgi:hypothetical protein